MLPILLVFGLSITVALVCTAIPWLARPLGSRPLAIVLVAGIALYLIGVVLALPLYPWIDLVVLIVAWSGGLLLGRGMPPRFQPFLLLFLCLSVGDVLVTAGVTLSGSHVPVSSATPLRLGDFLLMLPWGWGRFDIGLLDILLLTALAEHWRRRGSGYLIALLPGLLGFLLAGGVILVTKLEILPGIPFFTVGYLCTEALYRSRGSQQVHHVG